MAEIGADDGGDDGGEPEAGTDSGRFAVGATCAADGECDSGYCIDGVCCTTRCTGLCLACNVSGREGTCSPILMGEDPARECAEDVVSSCGGNGTCDGAGACARYKVGTECKAATCVGSTETAAGVCDANGMCLVSSSRLCPGGAVCQGASCAASCSADANCQTGFYCGGGVCRAKLGVGVACDTASQCGSGHCADRVCCASQCTELCSACNLAGSVGTCKAVPAGQDPRNVCATEPGNPCGNDGTCNGAGVCRRPLGTACGASTCSNFTESSNTCNGAGSCTPIAAKDCGSYACVGSRCGTTCSSDASCAPGATCSGGACVPLPGPVLHWKLDETSGGLAFDASASGLHGTYTGSSGAPLTSAIVPPVMFPNAASRSFSRAQRHTIQIAPLPAALKPTTELTVAVWYRTNSLDLGGSELVSGADSYNLRILNDQVEIAKYTGSGGHKQCRMTVDGGKAYDGSWHHLAGVISPSRMRIYFDGLTDGGTGANCEAALPNITYPRYSDFVIGRHANGGNENYDFDGLIDEVRVWNRALSAAEIQRLAAGRP